MAKNRTSDQIQAKTAERSAFSWLSRQVAWEIRFDQLHRINLGIEPARSLPSDRPAA